MTSISIDPVNLKLIVSSLLLLISIFGSKLSAKMGVPTLAFFIVLGIIAGELLGINKSSIESTLFLKNTAKLSGVVTLTFILFSGGLETDLKHVRSIWKPATMLSTLGVVITALVAGLFLAWCPLNFLRACPMNCLKVNLTQGLLVGAIVASTDAAAVFSILRSRKLKLKAHLGPLLELESGSNDVMVYFLMIFLFSLLKNPETNLLYGLWLFILEMGIGTIGGLLTGYGMLWLVNRINLPNHGLYPALTLAAIFLPYGIVNSLHGSGFLAVYIAGIISGHHPLMHYKSITKFYEGFGWLLQIGMFITLGMLVNISTLIDMAPWGIGLSLVLMLIARPLSVFISLYAFPSFNYKHKIFVSWVGLRGAVPIVFATYFYGGIADPILADKLFHLIFFIVLTSILIQGSTLYPLAKWLNLEKKNFMPKYKKQIIEMSDSVKRMLVQLEIPFNSNIEKKAVVDLKLPKGVLIALAFRQNSYFRVRGHTVLQAYDKLFVVIDTKKELKEVKACLGIP